MSASAAILNSANSCINAGKHNKVVDSKVVVANAIDALTLLRTAHSHISVERKDRLEPALAEDIKGLCDEEHSGSKFLLGDNLTDNLRQAREKYRISNSMASRKSFTKSSTNFSKTGGKRTYNQSS